MMDQDQAIAREMDAVFAGVASTRGGRSHGTMIVQPAVSRRRRRVGSWLLATGPAVVALLGVGFYARRSAMVPPLRAAAQAPRSVVATAPTPVMPVGMQQSGRVTSEDADADGPPIAAVPRSTLIDGRKPARPIATAARKQPATAAATSAASISQVQTRAGVDGEAPPRIAASTHGCRPGDDTDDCIFAEVIAADRRLRSAYDGAARAGVSRRALTDIARRWRQARSLANDFPDETIRRYGMLARELDNLGAQPL